MNPRLCPALLPCRPTAVRSVLLAAVMAAAMAGSGVFAINQGINNAIWKMLYGVTDAQINSSTWLAADDDGDGISNGAEIAAGTNPFQAGSTLNVTNVTVDATQIHMTFPTQVA